MLPNFLPFMALIRGYSPVRVVDCRSTQVFPGDSIQATRRFWNCDYNDNSEIPLPEAAQRTKNTGMQRVV